MQVEFSSVFFLWAKIKQNKQAFVLMLSSAFTMLFALLINYFLTKLLTKETFGDYSFILSFFEIARIVFNFGFFYALSRLIVILDDDSEIRKLYGIGFFYVIFISLILSISVYLFLSVIGEGVFNEQVINGMYLFLPFTWVFIFVNFNETLLQSSNKIGLLSVSRVFPRLVFLACIASLYAFNVKKDFASVIYFYIFSLFLTVLLVVYNVRPIFFLNIQKNLNKTFRATKEFGFDIYIGSLVAIGSSTLTGILIGVFGVNNIEVGYYAIALQLSAPLSIIPNVIAISYFKKFSGSSIIDVNLIRFVYISGFFLALFFIFFSDIIILMIYGEEYLKSAFLLRLLSLSSILYGISDFYNKFLLSHGKGKEVRNTSFFVGGVLFVSNLILINLYGSVGGAFASILAGICYLVCIVFFYRRINNDS